MKTMKMALALVVTFLMAMTTATSALAQTEVTDRIELKPPWTKFVSAEVDKMPPTAELRDAAREAMDRCEDDVVVCTPVASGGQEAPRCDHIKRGTRARAQCEEYNQKLALDRQTMCKEIVESDEFKGEVIDLKRPLYMGISGNRGRGVELSCYKETAEYVRAKVDQLESKYQAVNRSMSDMLDPSKDGSLAKKVADLERELAAAKATQARLESLLADRPKAPEAKGAFNDLRFSGGFRMFGDTKRDGGPALTGELRLGFDVALSDSYEMYVSLGYAGGIADNSYGGGIVQAPSIQFRFPIVSSIKYDTYLWSGIEGLAVMHQRDFRVSDSILVGADWVVGFEWRMLFVQAAIGGANYGTRADGTAGIALIYTAGFGLTVPFDLIGQEDRFSEYARQTKAREERRRKAAESPPPAPAPEPPPAAP